MLFLKSAKCNTVALAFSFVEVTQALPLDIDFPLPNLPCTPVEANPGLLSGFFATFLVSLFSKLKGFFMQVELFIDSLLATLVP